MKKLIKALIRLTKNVHAPFVFQRFPVHNQGLTLVRHGERHLLQDGLHLKQTHQWLQLKRHKLSLLPRSWRLEILK